VVVSDRGCGFAPQNFSGMLPEQKGFGLSSIYERMIILGGAMKIESSPGNGSTITLALPCSLVDEEAHPA
jgi:signal transduction histidine kinase